MSQTYAIRQTYRISHTSCANRALAGEKAVRVRPKAVQRGCRQTHQGCLVASGLSSSSSCQAEVGMDEGGERAATTASWSAPAIWTLSPLQTFVLSRAQTLVLSAATTHTLTQVSPPRKSIWILASFSSAMLFFLFQSHVPQNGRDAHVTLALSTTHT